MATTPPTVPNHEQPNTHAGPNKPPEPTDEQQSPSPPPEQTASPKNPSPSQGNGNNGGDNDNGREGQPEQPNLPYFNFAPDSPLSQILEAPALSPPSWEEDQAVFFNLDCNVSGGYMQGNVRNSGPCGMVCFTGIISLQQFCLTIDHRILRINFSQRNCHRLL